ncbi:hypothetical protein P154DRAFT_324862 [Amniculicola lignicola CBS 123094]|uniref:CSI2 protein n=1 Tax=Amniculicola lignicola CBS 123094 TaxID=1392246 RepID=A0A6A5W4B4_9PLEO|nr:hypothetical protein P154DRAFT_324862 [Amniculicola lignicola CBS 123094]
MRPSLRLLGVALLAAPAAFAQEKLPDLSTVGQPNGAATSSNKDETPSATARQTSAKQSDSAKSTPTPSASVSLENGVVTNAPTTALSSSSTDAPSKTTELEAFHLTGLPTIAGVGIPSVGVPDTAKAPFMQKSTLPDGTVFICVGAALGFFGACVLLWRGLVAWSLHRSVKRAALAQNLADMKAMSAVPGGGRKRGMYNVVGDNSNMSLDRLSAAPPGMAKPPKPFAGQTASNTPPRSTSNLFFSPTAGGAAGIRDSVANRSSNYLPAGYYASGNSQAAQGAPMTAVGGHNPHLSTHSLVAPGNRFSTRAASPPVSPSLPPSRGYDRAPPSRDGMSMYNRSSAVNPGTPNNGGGVYGGPNPSQLSLNVPGGSSVAGGRAPSAYLEDLFENHGSGPRERY